MHMDKRQLFCYACVLAVRVAQFDGMLALATLFSNKKQPSLRQSSFTLVEGILIASPGSDAETP